MSRLATIALALGWLCAFVCAQPAFADRRVALVVGNSAYQNAPALPNPTKDAKAVADKFKEAGFDVIALYDVGIVQFRRVLRQFEDAASDADTAVVYFAGHGIEIHGVNYLIPVDAKLASDRDADDEAITLDRLSLAVDGAKRLRLILLDACRDNPFARTMRRQRTAALRGITSGLAAPIANSDTLIAFAARAGSAAEDGDADHSPFTSALISDLFVPGLDIRLAFGRVRDDVLKKTSNRQEPFVYGSLGSEIVALVPAPEKPVVAAVAANDLEGEKSDYNLVEKIGTKRAWEIFVTQHPIGFYADLARQQIEKLSLAAPAGAATASDRRSDVPRPTLAALETTKPASPAGPSSAEQRAWDKIKDSSDAGDFRVFIKRFPSSPLANEAQTHLDAIAEQRAWDKIKDSSDAGDFRAFIKRFPSSPLANEAQTHLDAIARAAQERAEKAKAEREAKAAEEARQQAEREAARKRAEAERQARLAEAKLQAEEAKRQAEEAARQKAEQEAALRRAQQEAKAAEEARQEAEREAARKRAEEERQKELAEARAKQQADAEAARQKAERDAALARAQEEAKAAEEKRQQAEREAALKREEEEHQKQLAEAARAQEAACKDQEARFTTLQSAGAKAKDDLKQFAQQLTCERLRPLVTAALEVVNAPPAENTPAQVRTAQQELTRLGCFSGKVDGALNDATKAALQHYEAERGAGASGDVEVTADLLSELKNQAARVCPLVCPAGKVAEGEHCVAAAKPQPVAHQQEKPTTRRRARAEEREHANRRQARHEEAPRPRVRQEAATYSGGGGGHGGSMIGVGF